MLRKGIFVALCLAGLLPAQSALEPIRLGATFDPTSQAIRPIVGYPGAAYFAAPLPFPAKQAYLSPDGKLAVLGTQDGWHLHSLLPEGAALLALPAAAEVIWSEDSQAFALLEANTPAVHYFAYDSLEGWQSRFAWPLPEAAQAAAEPKKKPEKKWLLAVDAVRQQVWLSERAETPGLSLLRVGNEERQLVLPLADPSALALPVANAPFWLVANCADGSVHRLEYTDGFWQNFEIYRDAEASSGHFPTGLRLLADGSWFSAWSGRPALLRHHRADGAVDLQWPLEAQPETLTLLPGSSFWALQRELRTEDPFLIFDAKEMKIYFIPLGGQVL